MIEELIKQMEIVLEQLGTLDQFLEEFVDQEVEEHDEETIIEEEPGEDREEPKKPDRKKSLRDIVADRMSH